MKRIAIFTALTALFTGGTTDLCRAGNGSTLAVVPVATDRSAEQAALEVGYIARTGFDRSPNYDVFPLETLLQSQNQAERAAHEEARLKLQEGRTAYDALDLTGALASFTAAVLAFEKSASQWKSPEPVVETHLLMGATQALLGDAKSATDSFAQALMLDPRARMPSESMPEVAVPAMQNAHLQVTEAASGRLAVYSSPQMAEVWLDGRFRGVTPLQLDQIPTGRHYLRLVSPGYHNEGRTIDVAPHQETTIQSSLRPTAKLTDYQNSTSALRQGNTAALAQMGQLLKVDRILFLRIQAAGPDITVFGILADGVTGETYQEAQKSFSTLSPLFRGEAENWLAASFRKLQFSIPQVRPDQQLQPSDPGYVPPPMVSEGINNQIRSGYIFLTVAGLALTSGITFAVLSQQPRDDFKKYPQTSAEEIRTAWFYYALGADLSYGASAILGGVGAFQLIRGYERKTQIDDVLAGDDAERPVWAVRRLEE